MLERRRGWLKSIHITWNMLFFSRFGNVCWKCTHSRWNRNRTVTKRKESCTSLSVLQPLLANEALQNKRRKWQECLTLAEDVTEASGTSLARAQSSCLLEAQHLKDLRPGHGMAESQGQVDVEAPWRAFLNAPEGTLGVAPVFVIAFLGVALGPLGSAQEKLHNASVIL